MSRSRRNLDADWPKGRYWFINVGRLDYRFKRVDRKTSYEALLRLAQLPIVSPKIGRHPKLEGLLFSKRSRHIKGYSRLQVVFNRLLKADEVFARESVSYPGGEFRDYYFGFTYFRIRESKVWHPVIFFLLLFLISRDRRAGRFIVGEAFARIGPEEFIYWPSK